MLKIFPSLLDYAFVMAIQDLIPRSRSDTDLTDLKYVSFPENPFIHKKILRRNWRTDLGPKKGEQCV